MSSVGVAVMLLMLFGGCWLSGDEEQLNDNVSEDSTPQLISIAGIVLLNGLLSYGTHRSLLGSA